MGVIEKAVLEGLTDRRLIITEDARDESHDRIGKHKRPKHSIGQDVVADRDLIVDQVVSHSLIDSLVMAAEQNQMPSLGVLPHNRLRKPPPLWGEEDHSALRSPQFGQSFGNRFDLHDHAWASPIGGIIDRPVAVMRPATKVHRLQLDEPCLLGATENAFFENPLGDGGEWGQDLNLNHATSQSSDERRLVIKLHRAVVLFIQFPVL